MTATTLLPCPFCGHDTPRFGGINLKYVHCVGCDTMGPSVPSTTEEAAALAWNRRQADGLTQRQVRILQLATQISMEVTR